MPMTDNLEYKERGYLKDSFQIFHLADTLPDEVPFHYHEFIKIFILLGGNVSYIVEGNEYELHPYDIVLINAGELHRPIVHNQNGYERIIIYLSPEFVDNYKEAELGFCFHRASQKSSHVIRHFFDQKHFPAQVLTDMLKLTHQNSYADNLYKKCKLLEFLILLNHKISNQEKSFATPISRNENILKILHYINRNLTQNLTIDKIADAVHLNRSYLMHKFKEETGYTIKEFITEKRLFLANNDIKQGIPLTEACYRNGFSNYSSFYRAYTEKYGYSPKKQKEDFSISKTNFNE